MSDLFLHLTPDKVLDAVEVAGLRPTGRAQALASYENRVYDVEMEDGTSRIMKFYRPGRWSKETIAEEHAFLRELLDEGMPVAAAEPVRAGDGDTVGEVAGIYYASFPKIRGRQLQPDEVNEAELLRVGRLLGRLHNVGARRDAPARPRFDANIDKALALLCGRYVPMHMEGRYRRAAEAIAQAAAPIEALPRQRLHGDCHLGNLVYTSQGPCFVDFDDCCVGPVVQDLWLLCNGEAALQEALCAGYEELRRLDRSALRHIEALRGLRMVRHAAWIAQRYGDPAFQRAFSTFEEDRYWQGEVEDLERQAARCQGAAPVSWN